MNPILLWRVTPPRRRPPRRRRYVDIPTDLPTTDAVFLVLRRMRAPIILLVVIFSICVAGLAAIPGQDSEGNPVRMSVFDAFYFASYTATTIGYGEVPYAFTTAQRMWVTLSIYLLVIGWAYAIGTLLSLIQDQGFREAVATQRFRRRVRRLREPFSIVAGYGEAGRLVCTELDEDGRRIVVVDRDRSRVDRVASDEITADIPGLEGDAANPAVLGLAGLDHPALTTVLALTSDDETNLAIVMTANLLRPDIPVIARVHERRTEERMQDFSPEAVINPNDRFGAYLALSMIKPRAYQLISWLMAPEGSTPKPSREHFAAGPWIVASDGQFGVEVTDDLRAIGLEVTLVDPADGHPDLGGVAGFVAGAERDLTNIALAEHAKMENPDMFVAVRQRRATNAALLQAMEVDSVFLPNELTASETLARITTPVFWSFVEHAIAEDDGWSAALLDRLHAGCGWVTPDRMHVRLTRRAAPAATRWAELHTLYLGDLLRRPEDRDSRLAIVPLAVVRPDGVVYAPEDDEILRPDDQVLFAGTPHDLDALTLTLFGDADMEYVATGRRMPTTWVWRRLSRLRGAS